MISIYSSKNLCIEEKVVNLLTFNPGLALTGSRTILPCFNKLTRHEPAIQSKTQHFVSGQLKKTLDINEL